MAAAMIRASALKRSSLGSSSTTMVMRVCGAVVWEDESCFFDTYAAYVEYPLKGKAAR
jgi:hypothetical protein